MNFLVILKCFLTYFFRFQAKFNPDERFSHVVFVDDSVKNVNACEKVGMIGVLYKDAKQMEATLKKVGITFNDSNKKEKKKEKKEKLSK